MQQAIDAALNAAGFGLGFLHTGTISSSFTAPGAAASHTSLDGDIPLTLTVTPTGGTAATLKATLHESDINTTDKTVEAALQSVLNAALDGSGVSVTVGDDGSNHITLTVSGGTLAIDYGDGQTIAQGGTIDPTTGITSPIMAIAAGGRISLAAPQVNASYDANVAAATVTRDAEVQTHFSDAAFQELGLLTSPTRFDGNVTNAIDLHLIVNGVDVRLQLASGDHTSIDQLVTDLQGALDTALQAAVNPLLSGNTHFAAGDIVVKRASPTSNILEFEIGSGAQEVKTLAVNVPDTQSANFSETNGAVTDLGFAPGDGKTVRASADHFFLDNTSLSGQIVILTSPTFHAEASLGFLSLDLDGTGSLVGNASFSLKDPAGDPDHPDRISLSDLASALGAGHFLFDSGATSDPNNGVFAASVSIAGGLEATLTAGGALSGLPDLGSGTVTFDDPDLLAAVPMFVSDPLGFGHSLVDLTGTALGAAAPSNGQLSSDVSFVISNGGSEVVGVLKASDTANNHTIDDLKSDFQSAIDKATKALGLGDGSVITVGESGGAFTLNSSDTGLTFRGNTVQVSLNSGLADLADQFSHLDFATIIKALQFVTNYLQSVPQAADVLNFQIPIINKSLSDLVDIASNFANTLDEITANPAGSVGQLETLLEQKLGTPSLGHYVSYDPGTDATGAALRIDLGITASINTSVPFNVDLAQLLTDIGLPANLVSSISSFVAASAAGNLAVAAGATFDLALGIGLTKAKDLGDIFLYTGDTGSKLDVFAKASGQNLNFSIQLGPVGAFIQNGMASLGGGVDLTLNDAAGTGRFNIVSNFTTGHPTFSFPTQSSDYTFAANDGTPGDNTAPQASASLPIYVGLGSDLKQVGKVPLAFHVDDLLGFDVDLHPHAPDFVVDSHPTVDDFTSLIKLPSVFEMLANPAQTVDGLDHLLGTLQDALDGQVLGIKIPFIGDALANNPAAQFIGKFREQLLQPLANVLREDNVNLGGLVGDVENALFRVFGTAGTITPLGINGPGLGLLEDIDGTAGIDLGDVKVTGVETSDGSGNLTEDLEKTFLQFDMQLGGSFTISTDVAFDLGVPALQLSANLSPTITLDWQLHLGFGIDSKLGFYFVPGNDLHTGITVSFGSTEEHPATVNGQLAFLAVTLTDETAPSGTNFPDEKELDHFSQVELSGDVTIADPNHDGKLSFAEMRGTPIKELVKPDLEGNADLFAHAVVDFSSLGSSLSNLLPSISTDIVLHWHAEASLGEKPQFGSPYLDLANITLDLGSFISKFAGPILTQIHDILSPLDWLIGPSGLLNMRLPLLSDLAGHTITMVDLIKIFDPTDGPKVAAFVSAISELDYLSGLVADAASGGAGLMLDFGDVLVADPYFGKPGHSEKPLTGAGSDAGGDVESMSSLDKVDLSKMANLDNIPPIPKAAASTTTSFVSGVTAKGGISFPILKPANIFKLLLGSSDVTLFEAQLPTLGFSFFYRQVFPIFGPLDATIGGGLTGTVSLAFGYDTLGLSEFLKTKNAADLIDGFFIDPLDPVTGQPKPQASVDLTITAGAEINLGIAQAGVEGGINALINFALDDLNSDGKVRLSELGANLEDNSFDPLAVFDISGEIDFFLRAFLDINLLFTTIHEEYTFANLKLFDFNIPFNRPAILGSVDDDGVLTLNLGPNAGSRLHGDLRDNLENIKLSGSGGHISVDSFSVNGNAEDSGVNITGITEWDNVKKIVVVGGANDTIDLSGVSGVDESITGGNGGNTLRAGDVGSGQTAEIDASGFNNFLYGGGGAGTDILRGGAGGDTLTAGSAETFLYAGDGTQKLVGGSGDDTFTFGAGTDQIIPGTANNVFLAAAGDPTIEIDNGSTPGTLDLGAIADNITFWMKGGWLLAAWGQQGTSIGDNATIAGGFFNTIDEYANEVWGPLGSFNLIKGGSGDDTFNTWESGGSYQTTIDGGKGNDTYNVFAGDPTTPPHLYISIDDIDGTGSGNGWDTDTINILGTSHGDTFAVTDTGVTAQGSQTVDYTAPQPQTSILRLVLFGDVHVNSALQITALNPGGDGDDSYTITSTNATVPVKVTGGDGNDTVTIGSDLAQIDETALVGPQVDLGPVVLVGGGGFDTVIADDTGAAIGETGNMGSFTDHRLTGDVEVGTVTGLGMGLTGQAAILTNVQQGVTGTTAEIDTLALSASGGTFALTFNGFTASGLAYDISAAALQTAIAELDPSLAGTTVTGNAGGPFTITFAASLGALTSSVDDIGLTKAGSIQLEGFEADAVKLGTGHANTFTIGNTITGMTSLYGGNAGDTINVAGTNTTSRDVAVFPADSGFRTQDLLQVQETQKGTGGPGGTNEKQSVTIDTSVGAFAAGAGAFTLTFDNQQNGAEIDGPRETEAIRFGASAADVEAALVALVTIGQDSQGHDNVHVTGSGTTADPYVIEFVHDLAGKPFVALVAKFTPLFIQGGSGNDQVNIQSMTQDTWVAGGAGQDTINANVALPLNLTDGVPDRATTNGVNANLSIDGGEDSDAYFVRLFGGLTNSLITVHNSGVNGSDTLNIYGTDAADTFLLRSATAHNGLAFVAMLNLAANVERVNYDSTLSNINLFGETGGDQYFIDDTAAAINIYAGGAANSSDHNFFQVGQLYQTDRGNPSGLFANVALPDLFATLETTKGWLSNGVSKPMTIHGGDAGDTFVVFHNIAELGLDGGAGDDTFIIQSFALQGSQDDNRGKTDVSGGAGSDLIQYVVNAPVDIDGGGGFNTVIIIGTEFNDDFVVTADGVFGAGRFTRFVDIQALEIDGAEGDDRFFVQGTSPNFTTTVVGGLGSDLIDVNGPTPGNGVVANTLLGHSGIISNLVTSGDGSYDGLKAVGISANIADADEPGVVVSPATLAQISPPAILQVNEDGSNFASYTVVLTHDPGAGKTIQITAHVPAGLVFFTDPNNPATSELLQLVNGLDVPGDRVLTFTGGSGGNWNTPQTVYVAGFPDGAAAPDADGNEEGPRSVAIQHTVSSADDTITGPVTAATINTLTAAALGLVGDNLLGATVTIKGGTGNGQVRLISSNSGSTITVDRPWTITPDATSSFEILRYAGVEIPNVPIKINDSDLPGLIVTQSDGSTSVREIPGGVTASNAASFGDSFTVALTQAPTADVTVTLQSSANPTDAVNGSKLHFFQIIGNVLTEVTSLKFTSSNYNTPQTVFVRIAQDTVVEGPYHEQITLTTSSSDPAYDWTTSKALVAPNAPNTALTGSLDVAIGDAGAPQVVVTESGGATNVIEGGSLAGVYVDAIPNGQQITVDQTTTGSTFSLKVGANTVSGLAWDITASALQTALDTLFGAGNVTVTQSQDDVGNPGHSYTVLYTGSLAGTIQPLMTATSSVTTTVQNEAPFIDSYSLVLSKAPTADVKVLLSADPTRTTRGDVIVSFQPNLAFDPSLPIDAATQLPYLLFTSSNWFIPQVVHVQASDPSHLIEGGDTKVFATQLDLVSNIQGPLVIQGGPGPDHSELTSREPVMLPHETNFPTPLAPDPGMIINAADVTQNGVTTGTIQIRAKEAIEAAGLIDSFGDLIGLPTGTDDSNIAENILGMSVVVSHGTGKDKVRFVTSVISQSDPGQDDNVLTLALNKPWETVSTESAAFTNTDIPNQASVQVTTPQPGGGGTNQINVVTVTATGGSYELSLDGSTTTAINWNAGTATFETEQPGGTGVDQIETLTVGADLINNNSGGTFRLTFNGLTTDDLAFGITAGDLAAAIKALTASDASHPFQGKVTVTGGTAGAPYTIVFDKSLGNVASSADPSGLNGIKQALAALGAAVDVLATSQGDQRIYTITVTGDTDAHTLSALIPDISTYRDGGGTAVATVAEVQAGETNTLPEIQSLALDANGGTFTLSLGGKTTADLPWNITAAALQDALAGLSSIGQGNVTVAGNPGGPYKITFASLLGNVELLTADATNLQRNEVQVLAIEQPVDATISYTLHFDGHAGTTTGPITFSGANSETTYLETQIGALLSALPGGQFDADNVHVVKTVNGAQEVYTITFDTGTDLPPLVASTSTLVDAGQYILRTTNPNLLVDEAAQVDTLRVFDGDDPSNASGALTAIAPAANDTAPRAQITGLGMPDHVLIAGNEVQAGITFTNIDEVDIDLGAGANNFSIDTDNTNGIFTGQTVLNAGAGADTINVYSLGGHTFINGDAGTDTINVSSLVQTLQSMRGLLTVAGDTPQATVETLAHGSPAGISFGQSTTGTNLLLIEATGGTFGLSFDNGSNVVETGDLQWNIVGGPTASLFLAQHGITNVQSQIGTLAVHADGGTYTLTLSPAAGEDLTTTALAFGASASAVQSAIEALTAANNATPFAGKVTVADNGDGSFAITFAASLGVVGAEVDGSGLSLAGSLQDALKALVGDDVSVVQSGNIYRINSALLTSTLTPLKIVADQLTGVSIDAVNTIQQLTIDATGGTFGLTFAGSTVMGLAWNIAGSALETALNNLDSIKNANGGSGSVKIVQAGNVYRITFLGSLAGADQPLLEVHDALLTNGAPGGTTEKDTLNVIDSGFPQATATIGGTSTAGDLLQLTLHWGNGISSDISYTVVAGDTGAQIVAGLLANADGNTALAGAGFHFLADGSVLRINGPTGFTLQNTTVGGTATETITIGTVDPAEVGVLTPSSLTIASTDPDNPDWAQPNTVEEIHLDATGGKFTLGFQGATTAALDWNATAQQVQDALQALSTIGQGNVAVSRNDDVYVVRFQGTLSNRANPQLVAASDGTLQKVSEAADGSVVTADGSVSVVTRIAGGPVPALDDVQTVTVTATGGTFTLALPGHGQPTTDLRYDASAEEVRAALQFALENNNIKTDLEVQKYGNVYIIAFEGELRDVNGGSPIPLLVADTDGLTGSVAVATRMDGINYYGIEQMNVNFGSTPAGDVLNVQGTSPGSTAIDTPRSVTNVTFGAGDNKVFVSSNADLDNQTQQGFDFLTGDLSQLYGSLNLDLGAGRHRLMISDEAQTAADPNIAITDHTTATTTQLGLDPTAQIFITGLGQGATALSQGGISYKGGDFYDGVQYWTGSGNDTVYIDGTASSTDADTVNPTNGGRTTTMLNTGLGNDNVTVDLTSGEDGFFVLNTMGGDDAPVPGATALDAAAAAATDNDTVDASTSTLPLIIFGGAGTDTITGGSGGDIILGDFGRVQTVDGNGNIVATYGYGGRGDIISSLNVAPHAVYSTVLAVGGADTITDGNGDDIVISGVGGDTITTGSGNDIIFGDDGEMIETAFPAAPAAFTLHLFSTAIDDTTSGGDDVIAGGDGNNIVIGGFGSDTITTGSGSDIVLGDNGDINETTSAWSIATTRTDQGGDDFINAGDGGNIVLGGAGRDWIITGGGRDLIFGDNGSVSGTGNHLMAGRNGTVVGGLIDYTTGTAITSVVGNGTFGGDTLGQGGDDIITAGGNDDVVIGGPGNDMIDGQAGDDLIFGDNATLGNVSANNPRFQTVATNPLTPVGGGTPIYTDTQFTDTVNVGVINAAGVQNPQSYLTTGQAFRTQSGHTPGWAPWQITFLDQSSSPATPALHYGNDYIAGGADDDMIFGQLGDDTVQGDGSIAAALGTAGVPVRGVYSSRINIDPSALTLAATFTAGASTLALVSTAGLWVDETVAGPGIFAGTRITGIDDINKKVTLSRATIADETAASLDFGSVYVTAISGSGAVSAYREPPNPLPIGVDALTKNPENVAALGMLHVNPSSEAASDGNDYIEGNGGNDTIFGGLGQDDIIGGSSDLFSLTTAAQRPDGSDTIFGGAGTEIGYQDAGNTALGNNIHSRDADAIVGDNGDIFDLVAAGSSGFLTFGYDKLGGAADPTYGGSISIIPRAVELLDYTPGGPDFNMASAKTDIGAADEIHGESGDDVIYGETPTIALDGNGNIGALTAGNTIFGDAQNDQIVGGYGNDWIDGGTGNDGIVGDDGRIAVSRNGIAEPLYGISATLPGGLDDPISTPGNIQQATINQTGVLKFTIDLTPFNVDPSAAQDVNYVAKFGANDIIYGGLGDDSIHGGAGDDAISGAEALRMFWNDPVVNPYNILNYQRSSETFAAYDDNNPLGAIDYAKNGLNGFFLNFDQTNGPASTADGITPSDGNDIIFGDLGNDWIVGGTGQDHLYGGFGDDLLNADDNLTTDGGKNDQPDGPNISYQDIAYGGGGRDTLIGNTGGDRLIDWVGEFNAYIVPFAPFGEGTVSRTVQPQMFTYLYQLSASDGADNTFSGPLGSDAQNGIDPSRNGEPFGELGLVTQQDAFWHAQTGAPNQPQAGNLPGGKRDVLRSADATTNFAAMLPVSGKFTVSKGVLTATPPTTGTSSFATMDVNDYLPNYFEVTTSVSAGKPTGGFQSNAYIIFDYVSASDFKFAGIDVSHNTIEIGHYNGPSSNGVSASGSGWIVDASANLKINAGTAYGLLLAVNGNIATLVVNNQYTISFTFPWHVMPGGVNLGLDYGIVGVGANNSTSSFGTFTVQVPSPATTFTYTENFKSNSTLYFAPPAAGNWGISNSQLTGMAVSGAPAIKLMDLGLALGMSPGTFTLQPGSLLDLKAMLTLAAGARAGLVYDYYNNGDFKFAALLQDTGQVALGHYTTGGGWVFDELKSYTLTAGASYTVEINADGLTVSMLVTNQPNGTPQPVLSHVYYALVTDGHFGLVALSGSATFTQAFIRTDDTTFVAGTAVQHMDAAAAPSGPARGVTDLTTAELTPILDAAIDRLSATLVLGASSIVELRAATVQIADLPGLDLGLTVGDQITISADAAGFGWFIDPTPMNDGEFPVRAGDGEAATPSSPAYGEIDLLTVVMHELGHILGLGDVTSGLMSATLPAGTRLAPPIAVADEPPSVAAADTPPGGDDAVHGIVQTIAQNLAQNLALGGISAGDTGFIPPSAIGQAKTNGTTAPRVFDERTGRFVGQEDLSLWGWLLDNLGAPAQGGGHSEWIVRGLDEDAGGDQEAAPRLDPAALVKAGQGQTEDESAQDGGGLTIDWNDTFVGFRTSPQSELGAGADPA